VGMFLTIKVVKRVSITTRLSLFTQDIEEANMLPQCFAFSKYGILM